MCNGSPESPWTDGRARTTGSIPSRHGGACSRRRRVSARSSSCSKTCTGRTTASSTSSNTSSSGRPTCRCSCSAPPGRNSSSGGQRRVEGRPNALTLSLVPLCPTTRPRRLLRELPRRGAAARPAPGTPRTRRRQPALRGAVRADVARTGGRWGRSSRFRSRCRESSRRVWMRLPPKEDFVLQDAAIAGRGFSADVGRRDRRPLGGGRGLGASGIVSSGGPRPAPGGQPRAMMSVRVRAPARTRRRVRGDRARAARADKHLRAASRLEERGRPDDAAELVAHRYSSRHSRLRSAGGDGR